VFRGFRRRLAAPGPPGVLPVEIRRRRGRRPVSGARRNRRGVGRR
jgi:hypothetical protein